LHSQGGRAALITVVQRDGQRPAGAKLLVRADGGEHGQPRDDALESAARGDAEELIWLERSELREHGDVDAVRGRDRPAAAAGHLRSDRLRRRLCRVAKAAGWRAFVVDPRSRFATAERFPEAEQ
jgi:xanthine dehydrogenase accessory factor